jgi:predicted molibdopterin-dependent oxidoreductase YjgC
MPEHEIFMPYDRMITIRVLGRAYRVPNNNSILRCLQFLDMDGISEAELCWNGECLDCRVTVRSGSGKRSVIACRAEADEGMEICELSDQLKKATDIGSA